MFVISLKASPKCIKTFEKTKSQFPVQKNCFSNGKNKKIINIQSVNIGLQQESNQHNGIFSQIGIVNKLCYASF